MKDSQSKYNFDIKSKLKAIFSQPALIYAILCIFSFFVLRFLGNDILATHSVFALSFIALIIIFLLVLGSRFLFKSDMTECIEFHQGKNKIIIKSPSRQLMPAIMNRLLENTSRPNKLIPKDVDPTDDPSKFLPLTKDQQEAIVQKEVKEAISGK